MGIEKHGIVWTRASRSLIFVFKTWSKDVRKADSGILRSKTSEVVMIVFKYVVPMLLS